MNTRVTQEIEHRNKLKFSWTEATSRGWLSNGRSYGGSQRQRQRSIVGFGPKNYWKADFWTNEVQIDSIPRPKLVGNDHIKEKPKKTPPFNFFIDICFAWMSNFFFQCGFCTKPSEKFQLSSLLLRKQWLCYWIIPFYSQYQFWKCKQEVQFCAISQIPPSVITMNDHQLHSINLQKCSLFFLVFFPSPNYSTITSLNNVYVC